MLSLESVSRSATMSEHLLAARSKLQTVLDMTRLIDTDAVWAGFAEVQRGHVEETTAACESLNAAANDLAQLANQFQTAGDHSRNAGDLRLAG